MRHLIFAACAIPSIAVGQAPVDTAARLDSVYREIQRLGAAHGESIWPGYRPDTFAFAFVIASRGTFLAGWRGNLPSGFAPVSGHPALAWRAGEDYVAASTRVEIAGRPVAQVVLLNDRGPYLVSTAFHEAFHVFERLAAKPGASFGRAENVFYLASYPLFDVDDEASFALEGRILRGALTATSRADKLRLARAFVAVRRDRHRRIGPDYAEFDRASEMNEGLAEYALVRALRLLRDSGPPSWRRDVDRDLTSRINRLDSLTANATQSIRIRYYQTGPALALLLDDLAGSSWKRDVSADNLDLQDALARASGIDDIERRALRETRAEFDVGSIRASAEGTVRRLASLRRARADSALAAPGVRLVLVADSLRSHDFGSCGFDPQNQLPVSPTVFLQTRWWKPCGGGLSADLSVPSVHDEQAGSVTAVIGRAEDIVLTVDGKPTPLAPGAVVRTTQSGKLEAPRVTVTIGRAEIQRTADAFIVRPLP
jgi:hypothetical protein